MENLDTEQQENNLISYNCDEDFLIAPQLGIIKFNHILGRKLSIVIIFVLFHGE